MKREKILKHQFVEYIPDHLEEGNIYVSVSFATVAHKCCCGCGSEVITPLSPTDWKLIFDGETVSLDPSIGNWGFTCRSHYYIRRNRVVWTPRWPKAEVDGSNMEDAKANTRRFNQDAAPARTLWHRLRRWFS